MSIRSLLGNWIARHNQLLWFRSNGQRLERSLAHPLWFSKGGDHGRRHPSPLHYFFESGSEKISSRKLSGAHPFAKNAKGWAPSPLIPTRQTFNYSCTY